MKVWYMCHPYAGNGPVDTAENLARARRWLAWLTRAVPADVAVIAPWIHWAEFEPHPGPEQLELTLRRCEAVANLCDAVVLVGGRISPGMQREANMAREVRDLTRLGPEPQVGWPITNAARAEVGIGVRRETFGIGIKRETCAGRSPRDGLRCNHALPCPEHDTGPPRAPEGAYALAQCVRCGAHENVTLTPERDGLVCVPCIKRAHGWIEVTPTERAKYEARPWPPCATCGGDLGTSRVTTLEGKFVCQRCVETPARRA